MNDADFAEDELPDNTDLEQLGSLAVHLQEAQDNFDAITKHLADAKRTMEDISDRQIPELMDKCGLQLFKTTDGSIIEIKEMLNVAVRKDMKVPAFNWLRDQGHGDLIKNQVIAAFGADQDEFCNKALAVMADLGVSCERKESVHASTLKAFAKEQRTQGVSLPGEYFTQWDGKRAKLKKAKK